MGLTKLTYVENKQGVFSIHRLARAEWGDLFGLFVPPLVAAFSHADFAAGAAEDEDVLDKRAVFECRVDDCGISINSLCPASLGASDSPYADRHTRPSPRVTDISPFSISYSLHPPRNRHTSLFSPHNPAQRPTETLTSLGGNSLSAPLAFIRSDQHPGLTVVHSVAQTFCRKASKDGRVDGADTRACEEGGRSLPCHGETVMLAIPTRGLGHRARNVEEYGGPDESQGPFGRRCEQVFLGPSGPLSS
jgi:hypothetical protein